MDETQNKIQERLNQLIATKVYGLKLFSANKGNTAISGGSRVGWGTWIDSGEKHEWGPQVQRIPDYCNDPIQMLALIQHMKQSEHSAQFDLAFRQTLNESVFNITPETVCRAALSAHGVDIAEIVVPFELHFKVSASITVEAADRKHAWSLAFDAEQGIENILSAVRRSLEEKGRKALLLINSDN